MSNARKLGNMTTHGLDGDFNVDPTDNTLVVDSTNNRVGIGSATPTTTLDITGTATATAFSGPLTGNVTGTTSSISNHDTDALSEGSTNLYYTNARADARAQLKIDALVDSAPNTLDTLNELAAALGDDANFSTTITNSIAAKLPLAGGTLTGNVNFGDDDKAIFGAGSDLQIYHDGTHSYIKDAGTGYLILGLSNAGTAIQNAAGTNLLVTDAYAVSLRYNGGQKLNTSSTGVNVTGNATFADNGKAIFGAGSDLEIFHNGSNSYITDNGQGKLIVSTNGTAFDIYDNTNGHTMAQFTNNAGVTLAYQGSTKLATTATGIDVTGTVTSDGLTVGGSGLTSNGDITLEDNTPFVNLSNTGENVGGIKMYDSADPSTQYFHLTYDSGASNTVGFDTGASGEYTFSVNTAEKMRIESGGHVGIGTNNPAVRLEIKDNDTWDTTNFTSSNAVGSGFTLAATDTGVRWSVIAQGTTGGGNDNNLGYHLTNAGTSGESPGYKFVMTPSGRLGIGNTDPDLPLTVTSNSGANAIAVRARSADDYGFIQFYNHAGSALRGQVFNHNGAMAISTSTTGTARLYIDTSGNVGIGTDNPVKKLDVDGDFYIRDDHMLHMGTVDISLWDNNNGTGGINMRGGTSGTYAAIAESASTGYSNLYLNKINVTSDISENANRFIDFYYDGVSAVRVRGNSSKDLSFDMHGGGNFLLPSGNVGIGTTSPGEKLTVNGSVQVLGNNDVNYSAKFISGYDSTHGLRITTRINSSTESEVLGVFADSGGGSPRLALNPTNGWKVGIGTTNPDARLHVERSSYGAYNALQLENTNGNNGVLSGVSLTMKVSGGLANIDMYNSSNTDTDSSNIIFKTGDGGAATERVRIKANGDIVQGNNGVHSWTANNTDLFSAGGIGITSNSDWCLQLAGSTAERIRFFTSNGGSITVGNISVSASATTYSTTSDRRLKENIQPIADATDKLMDMKPVTHTWIDNPNEPQVHGFIAQEMQEVVPEAVSGDAESDEMMSMDYGRITPVIVAALQDALNEIKELKTRIDELENT